MSDTPVTAAPAPAPTGETQAAPTQDSSPAQQSQPTPQEVQRYKQKINGEEKEFTIEELQKYASMGFDSHNKWSEAKKLSSANEAFLKKLKSDPLSVLSDPTLGLDKQALAMQILEAQMNEEALTPEEKDRRDRDAELESYRSKDKSTKEKLQQDEQLQVDKEWADNTSSQITEQLKASGLPYTKLTWDSTLQYMQSAIDAGYEDITPAQVMHLVKRDHQATLQSFWSLPEEELLKEIGDENLNRVQTAVIKKAKGADYQSKPAKPEPPKQQSYKDQIDELKEKIRRGEI